MSALPNSHEVLLKNQNLLRGRLAIIGVVDPALLPLLPDRGLTISEHFGNYQQLLAVNDWMAAFGYDAPELSPGAADTLVVFLPKARAELSVRLELALWLAAEGARLVLVGEKKEGIAGAVKQLKGLAPQASKADIARHCQVWQADSLPRRPAFDLQRWLQWHPVECEGIGFRVAGLPGIFSDGELDDGTSMLLQTLADSPLEKGPVLDFACGAGVIGTWLQLHQRATEQGVFPVDGVDVQFQAVACARATYREAGVDGLIHASDGLSGVDGRYAAVVTNPPFHTGIRTDTSMTEQFLMGVAKHLEPGGELRLVANTFLPYEALIRRHVGPVKTIAGDRRFTVWSARRH